MAKLDAGNIIEVYSKGYRQGFLKGFNQGVENLFLAIYEQNLDREFNLMGLTVKDDDDEEGET